MLAALFCLKVPLWDSVAGKVWRLQVRGLKKEGWARRAPGTHLSMGVWLGKTGMVANDAGCLILPQGQMNTSVRNAIHWE